MTPQSATAFLAQDKLDPEPRKTVAVIAFSEPTTISMQSEDDLENCDPSFPSAGTFLRLYSDGSAVVTHRGAISELNPAV